MKNLIKILALKSYTGEKLDSKKVKIIAKKLTRKELKEYINQLKKLEEKKNVIVTVPKNFPETKKKFQKMFPENNIVIEEDPELVLGIRIFKDSTVYKYNLKDRLTSLISYLGER